MNHKPTFLALFACLVAATAAASINSGSTGADGALLLDSPGNTIEFDPGALGIDAEGDGIFHFTTITVTANTVVRLTARKLDVPVVWLATGDVLIAGMLNLDGEAGQSFSAIRNNGDVSVAMGGSGGYNGGIAQVYSNANSFATAGGGPGGGIAVVGEAGTGGKADYMSTFAVPLLGGSGGAGGAANNETGTAAGGGGGGGGGAILIASSTRIDIPLGGTITTNGGAGGVGAGKGGGAGSGGMIRLVAPVITSQGTLSTMGVAGGAAGWPYLFGGAGENGIIRIESENRGVNSGSPLPTFGSPYGVFVPDRATHPWPWLKVVSIGGAPISNPQASFVTPDAVINSTDPVPVVIQSKGIPGGTQVTLYILPQSGAQMSLIGTLAGSEAGASATINVTFPPGYARGYATANWSQ